jgi:hypothetical protein
MREKRQKNRKHRASGSKAANPKHTREGKPKRKRKFFDADQALAELESVVKSGLSGPRLAYWDRGDTKYHPSVIFWARRQCDELTKKYSSPNADTDPLERKAIEKFVQTNDRLGGLKGSLALPIGSKIRSTTPLRDKILLRARTLFRCVLGGLDEDAWFYQCKNSTGTTVGVPFEDTSNERKFTFPISVSSNGVKFLFDRYMLYDPSLYSSVIHHNTVMGTLKNPMYCFEEAPQLMTVEKNNEIRRTIRPETTAAMFLQQGLMGLMFEAMKAFGLDVVTLQNRHKMLAWLSSLSGKDATIDWSSASDSVMIELLEWLSSPEWFEAFRLTRSDFASYQGRVIELNCYATMGNATTFPVESLVFWTIAVATWFSVTNPEINSLFVDPACWASCSVFGDDCVVPTRISDEYIAVMQSVGFQVNEDKTFTNPLGRFRESCGGDYFAGHDVRPFHVGAPTSTRLSSLEPWLYIILNRLLTKYILHFGSTTYVYHAEGLLDWAARWLGKYRLRLKWVPTYYPDDSGLKFAFDRGRIVRGGRFSEEAIARDLHGTYHFSFCRFRYLQSKRTRMPNHHGIRYNIRLKGVRSDDDMFETDWIYEQRIPVVHGSTMGKKQPNWRSTKRIGGYVMGAGCSSTWSFDHNVPLPEG